MAREVQLGKLLELYEGMSNEGVSEAARLKEAEQLAADPAGVAQMFNRDVSEFMPYSSKEAFHSEAKDRDTKRFHPLRSKTRFVAEALKAIAEREVSVNGRAELDFTFVDREIVTARGLGRTLRTASGKSRSPKSAPKLDLLLANKDGTPIVAELKVGPDRDPFYALIQALAHAAMLVTPNQLKRLNDVYPKTFDPDSTKLDVYIVLVGTADGTNWPAFQGHARTLIDGLIGEKEFTHKVRRIAEVKLSIGAAAIG